MKYIEDVDLDYAYVTLQDAQNYQEYLTTLGRNGRPSGKLFYCTVTVITAIGRLTSFYTYLTKRNISIYNPFHGIVKLRREKTLPKNILNEENMGTLLSRLKNFMNGKDLNEKRQLYKAHVIAELMYSTGARINEVMSLRASDIDFNCGTVKLKDSKTGKTRSGILNSFALHVLRLYLDEMREDVLFLKNGADISLLFGSGSHLIIWINEIVNRESVKLTLGHFASHNFRHAFGAHLLKNGCDIRYIQELLGHVRLGTTQVYTKVVKDDLRAVLDNFHPRKFRKVMNEIV